MGTPRANSALGVLAETPARAVSTPTRWVVLAVTVVFLERR